MREIKHCNYLDDTSCVGLALAPSLLKMGMELDVCSDLNAWQQHEVPEKWDVAGYPMAPRMLRATDLITHVSSRPASQIPLCASP